MSRNGLNNKGGRKKGSKGAHTLLAEKTKEAFIVAVHENLQDLFNSLITQAKKGNMVALKELLDRAWGKPLQGIDHTTGGKDLTQILVKFINANNND